MADQGDGLVQVAYLHAHHVSHSWHESMMRLVAYDAGGLGLVVGTAGPYMIRSDASGLVESRNLAMQYWLDETPHEWLWFVDTDMGFAPDTVERLVLAADPASRPVVGALCFALRELTYDGMGGRRVMPVPTLYSPARTPQGHVGFATRWEYPENTLVQVAGTGAACLLIHRSAAEKVRADHGDHWFDQVRYEDGRLLSEDLSFCYRLASAGVPVFVHTGVSTTHHKQVWIGPADYQPPKPILCSLCGYATVGDFYVGIPDEPGLYMHTIACGAAVNGQEQIAQPTHERRPDGTVARIGAEG